MEKKATLILDRDFKIAEVDRRLFGSFVEHLGRTLRGGIYEPDHPLADEKGFRTDVMALIREAGISVVRYPGGNFVSGYDWKDGIGPRAKRPKRLDLAWFSIEDNAFGMDEFADWSRKAGTEFMAAVNLGTGTAREAGELLEYCNHPSGTQWSDLRAKYGHPEPHAIKLWCLGNEVDGPWQIAAMTADEYGRKAAETAKIMNWIDPSIELAACGSCTPEMPGYPDWDREVLEHVYEHVGYMSLHRYYTYVKSAGLFFESTDGELDFPYFHLDMSSYIRTVCSAADLVKVKKKSSRTMMISFDEWGVLGGSNRPEPPRTRWGEAPEMGESLFNMRDALVYGSLICTLINHCDRVKIACQSLMVNAGGMISAKKGGPAIRQATFFPFQHVATFSRGIALQQVLDAPTVETPGHGAVPALQTAAVYNPETEELTVFAVNFDLEADIALHIDLRAFGRLVPLRHIVMDYADLTSTNDYEHPDRIRPREAELLQEGEAPVLPRQSWNVLRFGREST